MSDELKLRIDTQKIGSENDFKIIFGLMNIPYSGKYEADVIALLKFIDIHYKGTMTDPDYNKIKHLI